MGGGGRENRGDGRGRSEKGLWEEGEKNGRRKREIERGKGKWDVIVPEVRADQVKFWKMGFDKKIKVQM